MEKLPLSHIDTAWLRMDHPTQPMMITALLTFERSIDPERLRAAFEHGLRPFPRLRQRVVHAEPPWGTPYWEDDPCWDLGYHLQQLKLPPPGDEEALQEVVSKLMSTQLDLTRPLWQFHLAEGFGQGCALVGRVHHSLSDGPALMRVLLSLADAAGNSAIGAGADLPLLDEGVDPAPKPQAMSTAARIAEILVQQGMQILTNPLQLLALARLGSGALSALGKMMTRPADPQTAFRGRLSRTKRAAWSAPIALAEVKAVGQLADATVNDVMLAAVAGALRRYLQHRGEPVDGLAIRAGLSVNLRPAGAKVTLDNQAGAVLVSLPVGVANPKEHLRQVKQQMDQLKASPEASVVFGLLRALGTASPEIQERLVESYASRETAVMANVAGPTARICLAGAPLESMVFWVPALGRAGVCLSIISYAGQIRLGIATDQSLVPDPARIGGYFGEAFEALAAAMQPAGLGASVAAMSASLDEAMAALDAMLEGE